MDGTTDVEILGKEDRLLLRLRVRPGSRRDRIVGLHGGALKVTVTAAPERGKANKAVLELLAKGLGLRRGDLEIHAGSTSPDKTVAIAGIDPEELVLRIRRALDPAPPRGRG